MPRNLTLRCSDETYKRITKAMAVRDSGLFRPIQTDGETNEEAAIILAILTEWKDGLTPESLAKARDARIEAEFDEQAYMHEQAEREDAEARAELPLKRKPKADDGI